MTKFSIPIITAVALFPLIALAITVPFMVWKYRKIGSIPFSHALAAYSFVFYLMCAYFLVLLPLPADRSATVNYAVTPQLVPFAFIRGFLGTSAFSPTDPSTWLSIVTSQYIYEAFFNVLLLLPLGAYLRYYFRRSWWQTLLIGFLVSLSFETTQLTGIWGIYEHPYRLFDVDDLMTNTTGAMIGFWACGPAMRALPDPRVVAREARRRGRFASATRRALAFSIDIALSQLIAAGIFLIARSLFPAGATDAFGIAHTKFWISEIIGIASVFIAHVLVTRGQTPAQKLLRMKIVRPDATDASPWRLVARYVTLFTLMLLPIWAFGMIARADDLPTRPGEMKALAASALYGSGALVALWCVGMLTWMLSLAVRAWRARYREEEFLMLNGIVSDTRIMTRDGIDAVKARRRVLDVADVVSLEKDIANAGVPLDELMRRAGGACADEVRSWVPDPALTVVLCGSGNNGGDGWVCARLLARAGWPVTLVTQQAAEDIKAQPARNEALATCESIEREGLPIEMLLAPDALSLAGALSDASAIVDAILGTGFSGDFVREPYASWIDLANARRFDNAGCAEHEGHARHAGRAERANGNANAPAAGQTGAKAKDAPFTLAVDAPSGLSAQTGSAAQPCIRADETLTMLALKPGLLKGAAKPYTGFVELAELVSDSEWPKAATSTTAPQENR